MTHVATFRAGSAYPNRRVVFANETFYVEDLGTIDVSLLPQYYAKGEMEWVSPEMAAWVQQRIAHAQWASQTATASSRSSTGLLIALGVGALVVFFAVVAFVIVSMEGGTEATVLSKTVATDGAVFSLRLEDGSTISALEHDYEWSGQFEMPDVGDIVIVEKPSTDAERAISDWDIVRVKERTYSTPAP